MDEPLSNLMPSCACKCARRDQQKLHQKLNTTTDLRDPRSDRGLMTMATRIVIMKDGIVQQVGAPKTVYNQPANMFVAGFIRSPAMKFYSRHDRWR